MRAWCPLLLLSAPVLHAQDFSALDPAAGKALFERNWIAAPASTAATDGLGPYYNARSCAACHADGGGSAALEAMSLAVEDPVYGWQLQLRAVPGMQPEARAELSYHDAEALAFADGAVVQLHVAQVELSALQFGPLTRAVTLRRAPALGGVGLLEDVPGWQLLALADADDRNGDGISGRLPANGGRFGWKAAAPTLRHQSALALSRDLGLGSPLAPAAAGDCTQRQNVCLDAARALTGDPFEASATVLDLLVSYLKTLPPPPSPAGAAGAALFSGLGCAACHAPQLQTAAGATIHPYTDLLLHDMGPGLAGGWDPEAAVEWRTAPLWGLGQLSRYLHDGRAANLDEAILWHGGEAGASAAAYRQLNGAERAVLQAWLLGL